MTTSNPQVATDNVSDGDDRDGIARPDESDGLVIRAAAGLIRFQRRKRRVKRARQISVWFACALVGGLAGYCLLPHIDDAVWSRLAEQIEWGRVTTAWQGLFGR